MSHLWIRTTDGGWAAYRLGHERLALDARVLRPVESLAPDGRATAEREPGDRSTEPAAAAIVHVRWEGGDRWTLLALPSRRVRVNGLLVGLGTRLLWDRDEIHVPGYERVYFSTEQLAAIEACPGVGTVLACPRCRQPIAVGTEAVACPACGVWHHQQADLPCWTYSERCALCPQPTDLAAGFQWTPHAL